MVSVGADGYILGTDQLGRDIFSRLLHGARLSMVIAFAPLTASVIIGVFLGLVAGYYGKALDMISGRIFDVLLAFPAILLAIGIVASLGPGVANLMIAMVIVAFPQNARIVRGLVLSLKEQDYVEAARVVGASNARIMWRHILPNSLAAIIIFTSLNLGRMIIFAAGLSFLGLGPQPPTSEWGAMLAQGRDVLLLAPHVATIPGLAIFTVVLGANLLGDGLRDALDPRLRNT
jgi:peptide/nickel transport system permease protein